MSPGTMNMATPTITAILPARNEEATIESAVRSLAAQPEIAEIRVVNDHSTDRTGDLLARLAAELPQVRVLEAPPLPSGWVGKNHAAWFGAQGATTDWLLFTDADVRHLPGSAAHALANAELRGAALVSYSPKQVMETWWERAMIPFVFSRLAVRYSYAKVNDPESAVAAANGQFLFIRRDTYEAIGGHSAVAGQVLEDVALARRVKKAGLKIHFMPGEEIAETRMYRSFGTMWEGWVKNLYLLVGGSLQATAWELLLVLPLPEFALLGIALTAWRTGVPGAWLPAFIVLLAGAGYSLRERCTHPILSTNIRYYAMGRLLYCAALLASAWRYSMGTVAWKGRTYPAGS